MTDDLYERYKEALRVGHVAVLRGSLEEALAAYRTAASIAPSRALPHTSLGGVLLRLGHLEEALVAYAAAVARAPHDEGALLGQAEALAMAGQRVDAAQALDHVSEVQESAGRLPEAADTLRRALELEESPERARHQRGLLREIRLSDGDQAAEQLLARALRLRDEPSAGATDAARTGATPQPVARSETARATVTETASKADAARHEFEPIETVEAVESTKPVELTRAAADLPEWPAAEPIPVRRYMTASRVVEPPRLPFFHASQPILESETAATEASQWEPKDSTERGSSQPSEAQTNLPSKPRPTVPATAGGESFDPDAMKSFEPVLAAVAVMGDPLDPESPGSVGESQHQPTGDELLAAAEAADHAGDSTALHSLLLWTARAYAREGRFEAGLDATHRLLQRTPGDVDAHLVLVELYVARDWNTLAAEKLALLGRLAELNDDDETRKRVCAVAGRVFPKDERLGAFCA
jgi:tetratricopeptide (TPR) repeat protein